MHSPSGSAPLPLANQLIARAYNSGFPLAHDTYNGMAAGSDGRIYYVLSSDRHDTAGQMYAFDPSTDQIWHLGDLTDICGEKDHCLIAQGKNYVNFVEYGEDLTWAATLVYSRGVSK